MEGTRNWEDRNRFWCRSEDQLVIGAMDAAVSQSIKTSQPPLNNIPNESVVHKISIENEQFQKFDEPQYYQINDNYCTSQYDQQRFINNTHVFHQESQFECQNIKFQSANLLEKTTNNLGYHYSDEDHSPVQTIMPVDVGTFFHQFDPTLKQEFVFPNFETTVHKPTEDIVESRDANLDQAFADLEEIMTSPEHNNFSPESGFVSTSPSHSPEINNGLMLYQCN